jgi:hypothetical protein
MLQLEGRAVELWGITSDRELNLGIPLRVLLQFFVLLKRARHRVLCAKLLGTLNVWFQDNK